MFVIKDITVFLNNVAIITPLVVRIIILFEIYLLNEGFRKPLLTSAMIINISKNVQVLLLLLLLCYKCSKLHQNVLNWKKGVQYCPY